MKFSVIIPVYNEEESLPQQYLALRDAMDSLKQPYEIIFINDGSKDRSRAVLSGIGKEQSNVIIVNLPKHRGKSQALQAGFDLAKGELIITMDADLQHDAADIPKLWNKMEEGYAMVCGWRYERKDAPVKVLAAKIAGAVRKGVTKESIHDVGCPFRIFKRDVLKDIYLSGGLHRFFTLIVFKKGHRIGEVKITHYSRKFGKSKFNLFNRGCEGAVDLVRLSFFDLDKLMKRK